MRILLTNDDGYHAPGLKILEEIASRYSDDVWIVAPADEQSGKSRSLTLTQPIRVRKFDEQRYAVAGTPTDAVMMALSQIMAERKPDLILSGVNRGANLAEDVLYSGTVSAAMEGALAGIRSIALSQYYDGNAVGDAVSFATASAWAERVMTPLIHASLDKHVLVNVNFPSCKAKDVAGIRVTSQGLRDYGRTRMDRRTDPRGYDYYWLAMGKIDHDLVAGTDLEAVAERHVSVTPLHLDLTHRPSLDMLNGLYR